MVFVCWHTDRDIRAQRGRPGEKERETESKGQSKAIRCHASEAEYPFVFYASLRAAMQKKTQENDRAKADETLAERSLFPVLFFFCCHF